MADWEGLTPPYRIIVVDPPWHYDGKVSIPGGNRSPGPAKSGPLGYSTLTVDQIKALPVWELADEEAALFLWTTNRYLPDAFHVCDEWGFEYRQTLVWHKTGNPSPFGGSCAPNHAEFLIVGVKGQPRWQVRALSSVIAAPRPYQHSRKPNAFMDLIESIGYPPRVELFSREPRFGWDSWGFGYENAAVAREEST